MPRKAKAKKQRLHNEWFRTVSLGGRKSCPCCKKKLAPNESIWSWGNYICAKWNTITHFCRECFPEQVQKPLNDHAAECGCGIQLIVKDSPNAEWLTLAKPEMCKAA